MVSRAEVFANLATEQRWVIQQDRTVRWLAVPPVLGRTGRVVLSCDIGLAKQLERWVQAFVSGGAPPFSVQLVQYDSLAGKLTEKARYTVNGSVCALGFPVLDATLKTPARLMVELQGSVGAAPVSGQAPSIPLSAGASQLAWLSCNFKLSLGNLDTLTVSHIDAVTFAAPGVFRDVGITIGAMAAKGFDDMRRAGTTGSAKIVYYRPNLTPLATLACSARVVSVGAVPSSLPRNYIAKVPVGLRLSGGSLTIDQQALAL